MTRPYIHGALVPFIHTSEAKPRWAGIGGWNLCQGWDGRSVSHLEGAEMKIKDTLTVAETDELILPPVQNKTEPSRTAKSPGPR